MQAHRSCWSRWNTLQNTIKCTTHTHTRSCTPVSKKQLPHLQSCSLHLTSQIRGKNTKTHPQKNTQKCLLKTMKGQRKYGEKNAILSLWQNLISEIIGPLWRASGGRHYLFISRPPLPRRHLRAAEVRFANESAFPLA